MSIKTPVADNLLKYYSVLHQKLNRCFLPTYYVLFLRPGSIPSPYTRPPPDTQELEQCHNIHLTVSGLQETTDPKGHAFYLENNTV